MKKRTTAQSIAFIFSLPLVMGWRTATEPQKIRRSAESVGLSMSGVNALMIAGAALYLGALMLILLAITGVFGLTHLLEMTGLAAPGFSDSHVDVSVAINNVTAIWIACAIHLACRQAAEAKILRSNQVIERHEEAQKNAVSVIAQNFRTELKDQLIQEITGPVMQVTGLYDAIGDAEQLIAGYLANPETASIIDVAAAEKTRARLHAVRAEMRSKFEGS